MTPAPPSWRILGGVSDAVGRFFGILGDSVERGLAIMTVLVLGQVLLRRKWLATGLAVVLLVALSLSGENYAVELPTGLVIAALTIFVAVRFGILALCFTYLSNLILIESPATLDFSRWYAGRGLFLVGLLVALAAYAFKLCLGSRPIFGGASLDEA